MGLADLPVPQPERGEVMLKINYVGFCGSDLNTFLGRNPMVKMPVIPGHEVGATISSVGADVPDFLFPGQTVTVNPYTNCGHCASCRNGRVNACEHNETLGVQRNGAMRQYLCLPWQKIIPAPGLSTKVCALVEPMSVGFHAIDRAQVTDVDTVMVIGCGMVGLGAVVRASVRGATVVAVDVDDEKLSIARRLGAAHIINSATSNLHDALCNINPLGADVVVEAVGNPMTYRAAVEEVAFTGRIICIGYAKSDASLPTRLFVQKELDIRGSRNAMPRDFEAVIRYLNSGKCPTEMLISAVTTPENALQSMMHWADQPGKIFRILVCFD
jgi:threonine dehydrogenase-like Zn-dependent dehydrogenase